jgi:hypothetical protein
MVKTALSQGYDASYPIAHGERWSLFVLEDTRRVGGGRRKER